MYVSVCRVPLVCVHKLPPQQQPPRSSVEKYYAGRCTPLLLHSALRLYPDEEPFQTDWDTSKALPTVYGDQGLQDTKHCPLQVGTLTSEGFHIPAVVKAELLYLVFIWLHSTQVSKILMSWLKWPNSTSYCLCFSIFFLIQAFFRLISAVSLMYAEMLMFSLRHSPSVSTPVGLPGAVLRPGVEVLLGVGASDRDVGVLDLDTGVVDFSFYNMKR